MKQLFLACGLILMLLSAGCSKSDEPGGGSGNSTAKGNIEIDGHKANLKYAYIVSLYRDTEYYFSDVDLIKFQGYDWDDIDTKISFLNITFWQSLNEVSILFKFKPNKRNTNGADIYYWNDDASDDLTYTTTEDKVKFEAKNLTMRIEDEVGDRYLGDCKASFSIEGTPKQLDYVHLLDETGLGIECRSLHTTVISDPEQALFLKSLIRKISISNHPNKPNK